MSDFPPFILRIKSIALLLGFLLIAGTVHGAEKTAIKHLNMIGSASIHNKNLADSRQNAVDDALAAAVGQVVLEMLTEETVAQRFQLINEKIIAQRDAYIRNYRVVTESVTGSTVRALVQVDVAADRLSRDLSGLGLSAAGDTAAATTNSLIDVVVNGTSGHIASFVRLRTAISSLSGVNDLKMKEMSTDQAVMAVNYQGTARSMADALLLRSFDGFTIAIEDVTPETIRIRLLDEE